MSEIILNDDQTRIIHESKEPVEIRDAAGTVVFKIDPADARALAMHRKRKGSISPGVPGAKVLEHLQALQGEWDRTGGFDSAYMSDFLNRLRSEDKNGSI